MTGGPDLRSAVRRFPAGVAVLTCDADGDRIGVTVASLASISLEPPLVSVALGRELAVHELVRAAGGFAVSVLSAEQEHLAAHFARGVPPIALWNGVGTREGARGPLLEGALAWIECRLWAEYEAGDHSLFLGEAERTELGAAGPGLVYREGGYRAA